MLLLARHSARVQSSTCMRCCPCVPNRLYSSSDVIQAGDRVLLQKGGRDPILSKVLRHQGWHNLQYGHVKHTDIIGKRTRDTVTTSRGEVYRLYLPTLADYIKMTPRLVTPIYPADASLIVSLLDLHVSPSGSCGGPPSLEILEAGTGHGALTLYLARAIHAANPPLSEEGPASQSQVTEDIEKDSEEMYIKDIAIRKKDSGSSDVSYMHDQDQRRAVIHTIDVSPTYSTHAKRLVHGFRRGMYAKDVEFHVGDVSKWIDKQIIDRRLDSQDKPFLSHIVLDMPAAQQHFAKAAAVLYVHGCLLAFNPSITQIMEIVEMVKHECLPLQLDRVIELGPSMTGGREWDVRSVIPRARQTATTQDESGAVEKMDDGSAEESRDCISSSANAESETKDKGVARTLARQKVCWKMVCRPMVGYKVTGGGFLGVWRKISG
ncbi:hypothetical protein N7G274_000410 [Stereocaulon virgatum]|uniref:tRNA (adenine(58)-N(1))-methyltransferase catalytic subunit TRM61 n=1 Tax=Stereocaulon virgatum TaxID=373712 RepID=A0ABR4ATN7_9LECA